MEAADVLAIAVGVLVGAVAALKLIAPRTQSKVDDRLLARLEQVLGYVPGALKTAVEAIKAEDKAAAKKADPSQGK